MQYTRTYIEWKVKMISHLNFWLFFNEKNAIYIFIDTMILGQLKTDYPLKT